MAIPFDGNRRSPPWAARTGDAPRVLRGDVGLADETTLPAATDGAGSHVRR